MEKAFTYMFKDSMFKQKALCYFVLAFGVDYLIKLGSQYIQNGYSIVYAICAFVIALILYFPFYGYLVSCIRAVTEQDDNIVLPCLNFGKNFLLGLKYCIATIILGLLFSLISVLFIFCPVFLLFVAPKMIGTVLLMFGVIIILLSIIALTVYSLALMSIFAKTEWLTSFFRFPRATILIKNAPGQYFISLMIYIGIALIGGVADAFASLMTGNIIIMVAGSLISAAIATIAVFVTSYIIAKSVDSKLIEV